MKKRRMIVSGWILTSFFASLLAGGAGGDTRFMQNVSALRQLPDEGGAAISQAMRRSPALLQGIVTLKTGAVADSIGALSEAASEKKESQAVAQYFYAEALSRLKKFTNAIYHYSEFLSNWPRHPLADDVVLGLALVYLETGRLSQAESWLRRLITEYPEGDRVPLARLLLEKIAANGFRAGGESFALNATADTLKERERKLQNLGKDLDLRMSRIEARERLLADAENKLEMDRQRILAAEAKLATLKQQLDKREKELAMKTALINKREKELKRP